MSRASPEPVADALVDALDGAVEGGDADAVLDALAGISGATIYSDRHRRAHQRLRELKPRAVRVLHAAGVASLVGAVREKRLSDFEVWSALDAADPAVPAADVLALAAEIGVPQAHVAPSVVRALIDDPGAEVTEWCERRIADLCAAESADGTDYARHTRAMSAFRFVRWEPDDHGLAATVSVLARRRDPRAAELRAAYALELPWGADRRATHVLFEALSMSEDDTDHALVRTALDRHRTPGPLRILLCGAVGERDADAALAACLDDLDADLVEDGRIAYVDWLAAALAEIEGRGLSHDRAALAARLRGVDVRGWTPLARGCLGVVIAKHVPEAGPGAVSLPVERALVHVVRAFDAVRLDHMGCLVSLPVMFGLGELLLFLLDLTLGKVPPHSMPLMDDAALAGWVLVAAVTAHTHFSGNESLRTRLWMALAYFGALAAFLFLAVTNRVL